MTAFVFGAMLCALMAMTLLLLPSLRSRPATAWRGRIAGSLLALAGVAASFGLYLQLTKWPWQDTSEIGALLQAAETNSDDGQAWLALAEAYLKREQYALAARAFERSNQLTNNSSVATLNGLAESFALDNDSSNDAQVEPLFNRALQLDPQSPKALLYTGLSALRANDLPTARQRFATMLTLGDAPANVRAALEKQIAAIDAQLKPVVADAATTVRITVAVSAALRSRFEAAARSGATLFVFVRSTAGAAPLAVKRLPATLPQDVVLSAADAMIAGNAIQPGQRVSVLARLSASGAPTESSGDLYGKIDYVAGKEKQRPLLIDSAVP